MHPLLFPISLIAIIMVVVVWSLVLKGFALWYAARAGQKAWYIVLLVVNTAGILEIIYLIWFRPKTSHAPGCTCSECSAHQSATPAHDSSAQA